MILNAEVYAIKDNNIKTKEDLEKYLKDQITVKYETVELKDQIIGLKTWHIKDENFLKTIDIIEPTDIQDASVIEMLTVIMKDMDDDKDDE